MEKTTVNKKTKKCTPSVMQTCAYSRYISSGICYCDYLDIMGHRRGCPPEACDKYKKRGESDGRKKKTS